MQDLESSTQQLFELAATRWQRADFSETAIWRISGKSNERLNLLIHGFRGDHHGLAAIAAGLTEYDTWIPDLPGYGKSASLTNSDVDSYAQWLIELVQKIDRPVNLIGHSFGTLVCAAAIAKGLKVELLCLIAPITTKSLDQKNLPNRVARTFYRMASSTGSLGSMLLRSSLVVQIMSVAMTTTKVNSLRGWIHNQHHKFFSNYANDQVVSEGFWSAAKSSVIDYAQNISVPTLIIAGERDLIAPLENQRSLASRLRNSELAVVPQIGHLLHYEAPAQVAKLIERFSTLER